MSQSLCHSRLFFGRVEHARIHPTRHRFDYPLYFFGFDLDELPELDRRIPLFGYNRIRPFSIHDRDYGIAAEGSLAEKLVMQLQRLGLPHRFERVVLVTSARYFNYVFNPVSFYFCYGANGHLIGVMTEVNNTFGERHQYPLFPENGVAPGEVLQLQADKAFHVSPFNTVEGIYHFTFHNRTEGVDVQIDLIRQGEKMFEARLVGEASEISQGRLLRTLLRKPFTPHKTMPRILFEALRLSVQRRLPVFTRPAPASEMTIRHRPASWLERQCQKKLIALLKKAQRGHMELKLPDGECHTFGDRNAPAHQLVVNDTRFFSRIVLGGHVAIGEAYMDGDWDTDNLAGLLEWIIDNRDFLDDGNFQSAVLQRVMDGLLHLSRANTLRKAKENIDRHYSLNNDFFKLFLDPSMMYSSALYRNEDDSLEVAQQQKIDRLIELADLSPDHHLLEIGCGWGSLAIEAARQVGCRVTALTLSDAQYEYAVDRVAEAGLEAQVNILKQDYRTLQGAFDRIVSVEMIEAVGHAGLGGYFARVDDLLKPGGRAVIQAITVPDHRYDSYRKNTDFIQKHIFPGGVCPSLAAIGDAMARRSTLVVDQLTDIGPSYGRTLREWHRRFDQHKDQVEALGFDRRFRRMWRYYLAYCEAGFTTHTLSTLQMVLRRSGERPN